jgi:histidinol-phosphate aminotransferase
MSFPIRPNIRRMKPYSPGKPIEELRRETGHLSIIKLASNENPLGPSPKAVQAIREAAETLHLYPDASGFALKEALAAHTDFPENQIVLGNGSDELIALLGHVFLGSPEDEIMVGDPSFVRYDAAAHLADCHLIKVPLTTSLYLDLPEMARRASDRTKLIFLANPNNPTGTIITVNELDRFLGDLPSNTLVVLDEAYFEFASGDPDYPNSIDYVAEGKRVFGLRTFSKAYGMAGIRMGYGIGPFDVIDAMERAREPFNVNSLAMAGAIAALDDQAHILHTIGANQRNMKRLMASLTLMGVKPIPSHANFVCVDIGRPSEAVFEGLLGHGVIVRSGHMLGLENHLRISIGTDDEIDLLIEALNDVLRHEAAV